MSIIQEILVTIDAEDAVKTESLKDNVEAEHLPTIAAHYQTLESWDQKAVAIYMVDFHRSPVLYPMALDILRAPLDLKAPNHDHRFFAKVSALRLLDSAYEDLCDANYREQQRSVNQYIAGNNISLTAS